MPIKKEDQWTIEKIQVSVTQFIKANDKEPTAKDFKSSNNLPTARQIQRRFGGLKEIRHQLGLSIKDHTTGLTRSIKAKQCLHTSRLQEADLFNQLYKKYHNTSGTGFYVTRQFAYQQFDEKLLTYHNITTDICIDDRVKKHHILIDLFNPQDIESAQGCVRVKKNKIKEHPVSLFNSTHEVLFLCMNPELDQEVLDTRITKSKLFKVISLDNFINYYLKKSIDIL